MEILRDGLGIPRCYADSEDEANFDSPDVSVGHAAA